jgi:chromosome segregation ATPase
LDLHLQVKENESVLRAVEDEKKRLETTIGELRQQLQVADKPSDVKVMQAILDFETKGEFDAGAINELEANLVEKTEDLKAKIRQLNAANEDATFAF